MTKGPKLVHKALRYNDEILYLMRSDGARIEIPFPELQKWEEELSQLLEVIRDAIRQQKREVQ